MTPSDETRKVKRVETNIPVIVKIDPSMEKEFTLTQKELKETIVDMSTTGMGIISDVYIPEGILLLVDLDGKTIHPNKDTENNRIKLKAEVMSCRMLGGKYRVGVMIKSINDDDKEAIIKFIESTS